MLFESFVPDVCNERVFNVLPIILETAFVFAKGFCEYDFKDAFNISCLKALVRPEFIPNPIKKGNFLRKAKITISSQIGANAGNINLYEKS